MAERRPLVSIDGRTKMLPLGDTLPGGGGMLYRKQVTFTSSQSWTFPATALPSVDYDIIGGGGAGGGSPATPTTAASGGGGGGGDRKRGIHELVPGETYAVVVGAGGVGGVGSIGGGGGDSMFDGITALGGKGGGTGGSGAPGGAAGGGTQPLSAVLVIDSAPGGMAGSSAIRSAGSVGYDGKCSGGGAGSSQDGGSTSGGPGAGSGRTSADGDAATNAGCGGGGGGKLTGSPGFKGGDGFRGEVTITYWDTEP